MSVRGNITTYADTLIRDPLFVDVADNNLRLSPSSPAINAGINDSIPAGITTDLDGNQRIRYGTVDMGAYEGVPCISSDTLYVNSTNVSPGVPADGTSWAAALTDLQEAINISNACGDGKQIWVTDGTYRPTQARDIDADGTLETKEKTFYIDHAVQIYGGFTSGATMLTDRDSLGGGTILTGVLEDMGTDTAYHVITMEAETIDADWILDGLVIRDGRATGSSDENQDGGGIYNVQESSKIFTPIIQN